MGHESVDPFAWSLDAVIAAVGIGVSLLGIGVSLLGAVATVLVAALALKATNRANRAEAHSRARAERAGLVPAVATYLATWEARDVWDATFKGLDADRELQSAAAVVSDDARRVVDWMIGALEGLVADTRTAHQGWGDDAAERVLGMAARGGRVEARRRVDDWVATGVLNESPLISWGPSA